MTPWHFVATTDCFPSGPLAANLHPVNKRSSKRTMDFTRPSPPV